MSSLSSVPPRPLRSTSRDVDVDELMLEVVEVVLGI